MKDKISQQLDQLANYQAQRDYLALQKKELIDRILTAEIKARLEEIEAEFSGKLDVVEYPLLPFTLRSSSCKYEFSLPAAMRDRQSIPLDHEAFRCAQGFIESLLLVHNRLIHAGLLRGDDLGECECTALHLVLSPAIVAAS
jgi:hypothetical protein